MRPSPEIGALVPAVIMLLGSHGFQMGGVDAGRDEAQVINLIALRDGTNK
jgi:hypothetical protein